MIINNNANDDTTKNKNKNYNKWKLNNNKLMKKYRLILKNKPDNN